MKILQVTGFPNNGAGSGALITTQAEDFVKHNHEVCTILSENRTDFPRVPGVKYHLVPFTAELCLQHIHVLLLLSGIYH